MLECLIERDLIVRATQRPCETGTRRRKRLEPELFQSTRTPRVPRVRHHKAARRVKALKRGDPVVTHLDAYTPSRTVTWDATDIPGSSVKASPRAPWLRPYRVHAVAAPRRAKPGSTRGPATPRAFRTSCITRPTTHTAAPAASPHRGGLPCRADAAYGERGAPWEESATGTEATRPPKVPPRWFEHVAWRVHRALQAQWRPIPVGHPEQARDRRGS